MTYTVISGLLLIAIALNVATLISMRKTSQSLRDSKRNIMIALGEKKL